MKAIRKKLHIFIAFLLIGIVFGSNVTSFADFNTEEGSTQTIYDEHGNAVWTGPAGEMFEIEPVVWGKDVNHEMSRGSAVGVYSDGVFKTMSYGDYLTQVAGISEEQAKEVYSSDLITQLTHKGLSDKLGIPVIYSHDGTNKAVEDFIPENVSPEIREKLMKIYNDVDKESNGELSSGAKGTTSLYSNNKATKERLKKEAEEKDNQNKPTPPPKDEITKLQFPVVCDIGYGERYKKSATKDEGYDTISGPYSVYAKITPVKPSGFSNLSAVQQQEWTRTHQPSMVGPIKTSLGAYLDSNRALLAELRGLGTSGGTGAGSNYRKKWDSFASAAKTAASQPVPNLSVVFNELNKKGMARGGAWTYTLMVKNASVSTTHSQNYYDIYGCIDTTVWENKWTEVTFNEYMNTPAHIGKDLAYDWIGIPHYYVYKSVPVTKTKYVKKQSDQIVDGQFTKTSVVAITSGSYYPKTSYQELSVRCNKSGFDSVVSSTGSTVLQSGNASSTARSPIVSGGVATYYNNLTTDFFYNGKSCDTIYGCTGEPNPTATNDSANNKGKSGDMVDNKFGAQSNGKTSSDFSFFRDNIAQEIRNDVWWLKPLNVTPEISFNTATAAKNTYIVLDKKGTPSQDMFELQDSSGNKLFTGTDLQNKNYKTISGQANKFKWKANWASDKEYPHRMNLYYAYDPMVTATVASTFDGSGGTQTQVAEVLDLICTTKFNTDGTVNPSVHNKPKALDYSNPITNFDNDATSTLKVNFVKTSIE